MSEGFLLDVDTAILFYEACTRLGLDKYEDRLALLRVLVKEKQVRYIRNPEEFIKDKKVLKVNEFGHNDAV